MGLIYISKIRVFKIKFLFNKKRHQNGSQTISQPEACN